MIRTGLLLPMVLGTCMAITCDHAPENGYPFCNAQLPLPTRVSDLLSRMSLADKLSQFGNTASGISDLDIPSYQWWYVDITVSIHIST